MKVERFATVLRVACLLALTGLGLMAWSLFDASPGVVVVAMSVGQGAGTLSFLLFLAIVVSDLRRARFVTSGRPRSGARALRPGARRALVRLRRAAEADEAPRQGSCGAPREP